MTTLQHLTPIYSYKNIYMNEYSMRVIITVGCSIDLYSHVLN